jgi:hypothetical protein
MKASRDTNSPAVTGRTVARRSVWSHVLSLLATGAVIYGAGAASALPFSTVPKDIRLAG